MRSRMRPTPMVTNVVIRGLRTGGRALLVLACCVAYAVAVLEKRQELLDRADAAIDMAAYW